MSETAVITKPVARAGSSRSSAVALVAVALITVAGACLRFHNIGNRSLWTDEGVSWAFTRMSWYDFGRALWRREANMALYYLLLREWTRMGDSETMVRALSALASVATIPALYGVARRLFGTAVGLIAAVLLAVNAYSIRYAQEARSYSLVALMVTLATLFFASAVVDKRKNSWSAYIWTGALAIYTHFFAVLVIVAHGVTIWAMRRTIPAPDAEEVRAEFKRTAKWIALATAPIWIFIATTSMGQIKWIRRPGIADLYWFVEYFSGHGGVLLLALVMLAAAAAVYAGVRQPAWHWGVPLALAWFVVPVAITLLFSLARPVFLARYMIICLPALLLLAAAGIGLLRRPALMAAALGMFCFLAASGVRICYAQPDFASGHEDFRAATNYMLQHTRPGDAALFYNAFGCWAYTYYAAHLPAPAGRPIVVYPGQDGRATWRDYPPPKLTPAIIDAAGQEHARVWLVVSNVGPEDPVVRQAEDTLRQRLPVETKLEFTNLTVFLYGRE